MKNKIELLEDRLISLNNALGDIEAHEFNFNKSNSRTLITKDKLKNITDVITHLQKEISENDSITFKDIYKKFEELSPLLDLEKLRNEVYISEKEMYLLIMSNFDELKNFSRNLTFVKENQSYLELTPVVDGQDKIKKIKPLEIKSMDLETKVLQVTNNIDTLLQNYNETVNVLNEKFSMYNKLLKKMETK